MADKIRIMTVAKVWERQEAAFVEVVFLESARFYKLARENPGFREALALLQQASADGMAVEVELTEPHGDIIQDVRRAQPKT